MRTCKKCQIPQDNNEFRITKEGWRNHTCKSCLRKHKNQYRVNNLEKVREWERLNKVKNLYGLSPEVYKFMLEQQKNVCYICKQPEQGQRFLAVDHDHETGQVRKLLCNQCNCGLGNFKDNPDLLIKAAAYLIEQKESN